VLVKYPRKTGLLAGWTAALYQLLLPCGKLTPRRKPPYTGGRISYRRAKF
jgi:hypothetical protein